MIIEFKKNNDALKTLSKLAKQHSYINHDKIDVVELPECSVSEMEMVNTFEKQVVGFPSGKGTFSIYVVHNQCIASSQLIGNRKSLEKSVAEDIANMLVRYEKRYTEPISAFLVRFVPEINGQLSPDNSFSRIFNAQ